MTEHPATGPSLWPLIPAWAGAAYSWAVGGLSPLQVLSIVLAIAYTALKLWRLVNAPKAKGDDE